jgi:hypothetical protein
MTRKNTMTFLILQFLALIFSKEIEKRMTYFICPLLPEHQPKVEEILRVQRGSGDRVKTVKKFQGINRSLLPYVLETGQPGYRQKRYRNSGDGF